MTAAVTHVVLIPPSSLVCLHCGTSYAVAMPCPIGVMAAAGKAFDKEHRRHKLDPSRGLACSHCFKFGHVTDVCPKTVYEGNLARWIAGPDTGSSSLAICARLTGAAGVRADRFGDYPLDPSDFGRCHRFLTAFPELRARIGEMAEVSETWRGFAEAWPELEALYLEEVPNHHGPAPQLYARMKAIRRAGGER